MQNRQSKALERLLARAAFDAEKNNYESRLQDRLFLSLLGEENCHAAHILGHLLKDWELYQIKIRIEREIEKQTQKEREDRAAFFRELPIRLSNVAGPSAVINTGHLLLLLLSERNSIATRVLEMYNVKVPEAEEYLRQLPADENYYEDMRALDSLREQPQEEFKIRIESKSVESDSMLDKLGINLTKAAAEGRIDPVVGREKEIERLIQILGRRKKNNPILIGEAGVGKSAIVEGLALRIASGEAPLSLRGKQLYSLDIASLVAGTKYRGEFEERIKMLLAELTRTRNVILFIDEIHTIVGAGSTQGSLDTANMLKPALARGELQCVGATTLDEYRENIESDAALERRFQKIIVEPTTKEETLRILHNIKSHYEQHHSVRYSDEALQACVDLSERYITDRCFPDKAIDVLDEAGSKAHILGAKEPEAIRCLERSLEEASSRKREAISALIYEEAAEARLREIALKAKLAESRTHWQQEMATNPIVITSEHIEEVITSMTGIPVEKVSQGEQSRLNNMQRHLSEIVIGQPNAVEKVARSIIRSRAGLKDPNKPIGVFLFVGPTGVGKTHLAKELSRWMFDRDDALIRIDMSEYSEKHNVSRLIGSPPGYVGYGEGGQLTESVRRQPYSVVLFDEVEKAHPDVFNVMLQIFDDGQLTDGLGRKVDFKNTIIILTSNVGSRAAAQRLSAVGFNTSNSLHIATVNREAEYRKALTQTFAPEFINRIDDIVIFNTLREEDVERIVDLELGVLGKRAERLGYRLHISGKARKELALLGYEAQYGVRSLKRTILDRVEEPLAQMIVSGEVKPGDVIDIRYADESIRLLVKKTA